MTCEREQEVDELGASFWAPAGAGSAYWCITVPSAPRSLDAHALVKLTVPVVSGGGTSGVVPGGGFCARRYAMSCTPSFWTWSGAVARYVALCCRRGTSEAAQSVA